MKQPGLIVPPLTPFNDKLTVDYPLLKNEIDYIVNECGATMISAAGVETQEYHYLPLGERKELIKKTIEFVDGRVPVVVGVSHPSYKTTVELAQMAEELGGHAIQLLAPLRPFGGPPTLEDLESYFNAVVKETRLPILLYLNPGPGAEANPAWTLALAKMPRIEYIKESSRDLARVSRLIVEIDLAGHARYFTTMQMLLATIQLGGSGATMPPPGARIARALIDAFLADDHQRAAELQRQFALFPAKWMGYGLAPALKAAMEIVGLPLGDPYPPFQAVNEKDKKAMADHLKTTYLFEEAPNTGGGKEKAA
jgi:4-hydroxy-tetrahydrodipicolinate synthase